MKNDPPYHAAEGSSSGGNGSLGSSSGTPSGASGGSGIEGEEREHGHGHAGYPTTGSPNDHVTEPGAQTVGGQRIHPTTHK